MIFRSWTKLVLGQQVVHSAHVKQIWPKLYFIIHNIAAHSVTVNASVCFDFDLVHCVFL